VLLINIIFYLQAWNYLLQQEQKAYLYSQESLDRTVAQLDRLLAVHLFFWIRQVLSDSERVGTRAFTLVSHGSRLHRSLGTTSITLKKKTARRLWLSSIDKQQSLIVADIFYFLCFTSETKEIIETTTRRPHLVHRMLAILPSKCCYIFSVKLNDLDKLSTTKNNTTVGIT